MSNPLGEDPNFDLNPTNDEVEGELASDSIVQDPNQVRHVAVSYTHLTLPTKRIV